MRSIVGKLAAWFWYLLPANPILVRVVCSMSRRTRHLWLRLGYLSVLLIVVLISLMSQASALGSLSSLAKGAAFTFMVASITQLALMCFLAPVFTAGAITQEKDAQTYNILICTPLSNAQIVIGSLASRLYFVIVLLAAGLPIFFTTMIYGGVTSGQIVRSFAITGATAVLTGSLAITISMMGVGTRRTIFSFYITIALFLLSVYALGRWSRTWVPEAPLSPVTETRMSWLAAFHPFLALDVALNRVQAPDLAAAARYGPVGRYFIAYPHAAYIAQTLLLSALLIVVSMFFVRRVTREGELTIWTRLVQRFRPSAALGERKRKPHTVWSNPVAWREAVTRASAASRGIGRYVVIGGGLIGAGLLMYAYVTDKNFTAADVQTWLAALIAIEFGLVLLVGTNTAASALTKEKESKTLDILLTTPLTSEYLIRGKLRGLVSFVVPMIGVPVVSLLAFGLYDLVHGSRQPAAFIESAVEVGGLLVVFSAYACLLGLHFSLKQTRTVRAVILAVGVLVVANLAAYYFWWAIVSRAEVVGVGLSAATPFTAIFALVDPARLFDSPQVFHGHAGAVRWSALVGCWLFIALHTAVVYAWYKSMVRSFDMIIRKQSGQM